MTERIEAIVELSISASPEKVYACWLEPNQIKQWMSNALQAMNLPGDMGTIEVDPQVGGKFCFSDRRPMGEAFHWGHYKRLEASSCIAFTWNAGLTREERDDDLSLVTINIMSSNTGCEVVLVHSMDSQWKEYLQRTEHGWRNMLVHISAHLSIS